MVSLGSVPHRRYSHDFMLPIPRTTTDLEAADIVGPLWDSVLVQLTG
jgi:hypothetical protein